MPNQTILVCIHNKDGSTTIIEALEQHIGTGVEGTVYSLSNHSYASIDYYCKVNKPLPSKKQAFTVFHTCQPVAYDSVIKVLNPTEITTISSSNKLKLEQEQDEALQSDWRDVPGEDEASNESFQLAEVTHAKILLQRSATNKLQQIYDAALTSIQREATFTCKLGKNHEAGSVQALSHPPVFELKFNSKSANNFTLRYSIKAFNIALIMPFVPGMPLYQPIENKEIVSLKRFLIFSTAALLEVDRIHHVKNTIHGDIHGKNIHISQDGSEAFLLDAGRATEAGSTLPKYCLTKVINGITYRFTKHAYTTTERQTYDPQEASMLTPAEFRQDLFALVQTFLDFFEVIRRTNGTQSISIKPPCPSNNHQHQLQATLICFLHRQLLFLAKIYDDPALRTNDSKYIKQLFVTTEFLLNQLQEKNDLVMLNEALKSPWVAHFLVNHLIGTQAEITLTEVRKVLNIFTPFSAQQLETINSWYIDFYQQAFDQNPNKNFLEQIFQHIVQLFNTDINSANQLSGYFMNIQQLAAQLESLEFNQHEITPNQNVKDALVKTNNKLQQLILSLPDNILKENTPNINTVLIELEHDIDNIRQTISELRRKKSPDTICGFEMNFEMVFEMDFSEKDIEMGFDKIDPSNPVTNTSETLFNQQNMGPPTNNTSPDKLQFCL